MARKHVGFRVADGWPTQEAGDEVRINAIEALIANHTLIVGQSRSGKTNAARRLIEEILLATQTRIVLLDPNADFRFLSEANRKDFETPWKPVASLVRTAALRDAEPWGIPWGDLSLDEMAAFLKLSAVDTFAEYQHLVRHFDFEKESVKRLGTIGEFRASRYFQVAPADESLERYRLRLKELSDLHVWAEAGRMDLDSLLVGNYRAAVVDLALDNREVRAITAARALQVLWRHGEKMRARLLEGRGRGRRVGTLVVIDEAHLFAPAVAGDPQERLVSERIERFADQGKKLNLYLMLLTQQPSKLNGRILAECNNRIILRMNERLSLKALEDTYGGAKGRYDGALTFSQGEALIEGAFLCDENPPSPVPRAIRFDRARTREGGATPDTRWARPKVS